MSGLKLAALYGINPHLLGYCGPQKKSETQSLLNYLSGRIIPEKKVRKILKEFKGAYFYYKLIARSNKIKDPFNEKAVKAYWIGNSLLEKVKVGNLKKMLANDFRVEKEIFWNKIFTPKVKAGDWVSIHWNRLIQVLSKKDLTNLQKYTKSIINRQFLTQFYYKSA